MARITPVTIEGTVGLNSKPYTTKDIQESLNKHGYNLDVDGKLGPLTTAAIKDFQKNNGLTVDGIVGTNTWSALRKTPSTTPTTNAPTTNIPTTNTPTTGTPTTNTPAQAQAHTFNHTQSDAVNQKWVSYDELKANTPGEADKTWFDKLIDAWNQIDNREKFSYDLNGDALYQQYKDQYTTQGKLAMMDTMGQAAAMTGGYGNSYAQSVGQRAYQGYLQQLNDKVPELYKLALDQYNQEGQDLYNKAGLLYQMDELVYNKNQAEWDKYYKNLGLAFDEAKYADDTEYGRALDLYQIENNSYWNNKNFNYQKEQDAIANGWKQKEYDLALENLRNGQGDGSGGGDTGAAGSVPGVSDSISTKAAGFTNNADLGNYLDGLTDAGIITEEQADKLYATNKQADVVALSERNWKLGKDGGVNWFGGIDNNATVTDQYGNTYRLDKLVDALVAEGMDKKVAKDYVKKLQAQVGA